MQLGYWIASLVIGVLSVGSNVAIGIFVYGRLTERNKVHTEQIKGLQDKTDKHDGELGVVYGTLRLKR